MIQQLNDSSILCQVPGHTLLKVTGKDAITFLQGQLTNDVQQLANGQAQLNCRLTLKGKIHSFFSLGRRDSDFYLFIRTPWAQTLQEELQRYIIMEDIQFSPIQKGDFTVCTGALAYPHNQIPIYHLGLQGHLADPDSNAYTPNDLKKAIIYSGHPEWGKSVEENDFINETILNQCGISYKKGCFFGQEIAAKINSGRGGNYFPCLLKLNNTPPSSEDLFISGEKIGKVIDSLPEEHILYCKIKRSHRILGREMSFEIAGQSCQGQLIKFPQIGQMDDRELSRHLFIEATRLYNQKNDAPNTVRLLESAIALDGHNCDAYEALGVIYGHQKKYHEAISTMQKLNEIARNSIMAHSNLSLFYMKIGEIAKAEEEKAKATVLGMKQASLKAQEKKEEKQQKLAKRAEMYRQVLAIDPYDSFAHYGLADIYFEWAEISKSIEHARKALEANPKYSKAYLLLGKALEAMEEWEQAKNTYREGSQVAAAQGDTASANEMQAKLSEIK